MNTRPDLSFCRSFGYPGEVANHLEEISSLITRTLGEENLASLILIGSASRGELSYVVGDHRIDLFSDYDLWAVTRKPVPGKLRSRLAEDLQRISGGWSRNHLFDVGLTINTLAAFRVKAPFDRRLTTYDAALTGRILLGEQLLDALPSADVSRLDLGKLNELIIVRLWMQALFTPAPIVRKQETEYERAVYAYMTARNLLETTTILLANQGLLPATYAERVAKAENRGPKLHPAYAGLLKKALGSKANPSLCAGVRLEDLLITYANLTGWLGGWDGVPPGIMGRREIDLKRLEEEPPSFTTQLPSTLRRIRDDARVIHRIAASEGPGRALGWALSPQRPTLLRCLFAMNLALTELRQQDDAQAELYLRDVAVCLRELGEPVGHSPGSLEDRWLHLRYHLVRFMSLWFYGTSEVDKFEPVINWQDPKRGETK